GRGGMHERRRQPAGFEPRAPGECILRAVEREPGRVGSEDARVELHDRQRDRHRGKSGPGEQRQAVVANRLGQGRAPDRTEDAALYIKGQRGVSAFLALVLAAVLGFVPGAIVTRSVLPADEPRAVRAALALLLSPFATGAVFILLRARLAPR